MARSQVIYFCWFCLILLDFNHVHAFYKFNSIDCEYISEEYGRVNVCEIKTIDRKRNMLNIETILSQTVTQMDIKFKMTKRNGGSWQPFMNEMSVDICQFFKNPKKFFIPNFMFSFMQPYTNINHTCPYVNGSRLSLWNFTPAEVGVVVKVPIEPGQYGMNSTWYVNKVPAMHINGTLLFYK